MMVRSLLGRGMVLGSSNPRCCSSIADRSLSSVFDNGIGAVSKSLLPVLRGFHTMAADYAARKGTRARKEKGRVKKEEVKKSFLVRQQYKKEEMVYKIQRPFDKSHYPAPVDDVYFYRKYQYTQWNFAEAVQNHREVHDPSVYNVPDSPLVLRIDMDFRYPNRHTKCMDKWKCIIEMPHPFLLPGMVLPTVLAICPANQNELIAQSIEAGADMAGSTEIIKSIQTGDIHSTDYEYIVCHPLMITEMSVIRGLCKKNFPNVRSRTIDMDLPAAIKRLKGGLKVSVNCSDREPDYAYIEVPIGSLTMDTASLQENFEAVLRDTLGRRVTGKTPQDYILQCVLKTPHSFEQFKLNVDDYLVKLDVKRKGKQAAAESEVEEEEAADQPEKQSATA